MKRGFLILSALLLVGCGKGGADESASDEPVADVRVATAEFGSSNGAIVAYGATEAGPGATHSLVAPAEAIVDAVWAPTGTSVSVGHASKVPKRSATFRLPMRPMRAL